MISSLMTFNQKHSIGARAASHSKGLDFYPSPPEAVHALLEVEEFPNPVWEPADGAGSISNVLTERGYYVIRSDIVDHGYNELDDVRDFLEYNTALHDAKSIITNPPYNILVPFVEHSLRLVNKVAILAPIRYVEGANKDSIMDRNPPKAIYPFRKRLPRMHLHGYEGKKTSSAICFAWFVWDNGYEGPTTLKRV